jgi:putative flippase GtrA
MLFQYVKFFLNGGILGIVALVLQLVIYNMLGGEGSTSYAMAATLTYPPLVIINFIMQRKWVFDREGIFWRFVFANLAIMVLVSAMALVFKISLDLFIGAPWGERLGFIFACLIGSIPSFFLKRNWVFGNIA